MSKNFKPLVQLAAVGSKDSESAAGREMVLVGRGILTWDASERRSDRYGYIYLLNSGDSLSAEHDPAEIAVRSEHLGSRVRLSALIASTRKSTHIGDLFHAVFPSTPKVGDIIELGVGLLSIGYNSVGGMTVGVRPFDDDRADLWLNIRALYRCHEQSVELRYEPLEPADGAQMERH